jgi:hypothetical protein
MANFSGDRVFSLPVLKRVAMVREGGAPPAMASDMGVSVRTVAELCCRRTGVLLALPIVFLACGDPTEPEEGWTVELVLEG